MKHLLLTTIAAVVLVGCGPSVNIYKAAATKNIEVVKQYLAAGNDVNKKNVVSQTPLHYASASGDKEIIELLIAKDADLNATDKFGKTPLDLANMNGRTETADLLRKHGGKSGVELSIHAAVRVGNIEAVKKYIAMGENLDSKDAEGQTPLCRAVQLGEKDMIKLLIEEGADVNARMNFGDTALDYANASGGLWMSYEVQKEVVDLLRKHGGKTGEELEVAAD